MVIGVMNDTKWEELRLAMHALDSLRPRFQIKDRDAESPAAWDGEWFYHFREQSYDSIQWVDIETLTPEQRAAVRECLRAIHVPGVETKIGFRVFGWVSPGAPVDYIT